LHLTLNARLYGTVTGITTWCIAAPNVAATVTL
jgi:hypothetical protein